MNVWQYSKAIEMPYKTVAMYCLRHNLGKLVYSEGRIQRILSLGDIQRLNMKYRRNIW
jgi:hypothetical protein